MTQSLAPVLSPAQQQVVAHRGGDLQVIACAGSGKTESMASRVAALVAEGVAPAGIVACTFTEKAARELRERISRRVAERLGAGFRDRLAPLFVGTIHAYCLRLLQDHVPRYGSYELLDENRHAGLLSRDFRLLGLASLGARRWQPIRDFAWTLDVIGNELIRPEQLEGSRLGECVRAHRALLARYRCLTYADLVTAAVAALEQPAIRARVHADLRHLLVDEYQDINPAQERLIELLAQPPVQLVVVGDDDQAIYQWRGSDVHHILDFTRRRPGAATVALDLNRRSRPTLLAAANRVAATIPHRLTKQMKATRPPGQAEVVAWAAETEEEEAEQVARTILRLQTQGHRLRDLAVLYRSVRTSAAPLLDAFDRLGVPYTCSGRTGVLTLDPELPADAARLGALARFSEVLADFEHVHRRGRQTEAGSRYPFEAGPDRGRGFFQALYGYLLHWARDACEDVAPEAVADLEAVTVSTVHQAKGLEWAVVFLPALVQGRFPSARAGRARTWLLPATVFPRAAQARYEGGEAEERRLFYVAMTRSRGMRSYSGPRPPSCRATWTATVTSCAGCGPWSAPSRCTSTRGSSRGGPISSCTRRRRGRPA